MPSYQLMVEQRDGTWSAFEFRYTDDDDAVRHALRLRTRDRCELYQADRWLATFDAAPHGYALVPANDNLSQDNSGMETHIGAMLGFPRRCWSNPAGGGRPSTVGAEPHSREPEDQTRAASLTTTAADAG